MRMIEGGACGADIIIYTMLYKFYESYIYIIDLQTNLSSIEL